MRIAILGIGNVGSTLARAWAGLDYSIVLGSRNPDSIKILKLVNELGVNASVGTYEKAVEHADIIVLAAPWTAIQDICRSIKPFCKGKIVIDCTNPLDKDFKALVIDPSTSAGELIAGWLPDSSVVKAFNTVGTMVMEHPQFDSHQATLFIAGDDMGAKKKVSGLAKRMGFDVIDAGDITISRYLESLALFWIHLAFEQGLSPDYAFYLLRRTEGV